MTKPTKPPMSELVDGKPYWVQYAGVHFICYWDVALAGFDTQERIISYDNFTHIEPVAEPSWAEGVE